MVIALCVLAALALSFLGVIVLFAYIGSAYVAREQEEMEDLDLPGTPAAAHPKQRHLQLELR